MLSALAWAATAAILLTYAMSTVRSEWVRRFDIANAVGCVPLVALAALAGVWPSAAVSGTFGVVGALATWRHTIQPRRLRRARRKIQAALQRDAEAAFQRRQEALDAAVRDSANYRRMTEFKPEPLETFPTAGSDNLVA